MRGMSSAAIWEMQVADFRVARVRGRARGWSSATRMPRSSARSRARSPRRSTPSSSRSPRSSSSDDGPPAGNSPGKIPPRRRRDLSGAEGLRAKLLLGVLGVGGGTSVGIKRWRGPRLGNGWQVEPGAPGALGEWRLGHALRSSTGLDVRGLNRVGYVDFDLDLHGVDVAALARDEAAGSNRLDDVLDASRAAIAKARRRIIAERLRQVVSAILQIVPEAVVDTSGRGLHVQVLLDRPHPVAHVRRIGLRILEVAGLAGRCDIETFPKIGADGKGAMCRLPLTNGARILREDLVSLATTSRAADQELLLSCPRLTSARLAEILDCADGDVGGSALSLPPSEPRHREAPEITRGRSGKRVPGDQLFGREFSGWLVETARCIPAGQSHHFCDKFAALAVYADCDDEEAAELFRACIERPGHEASSCSSAARRRNLMRKFRCQLRHQRRGVESGNVKPGRLRNRDALALLDALRRDARIPIPVPDRPATTRTWSEVVASRRAAKAKAWTTRRAKARGELVEVSPVEVVDEEIAAAEADVERIELDATPLRDFMLPFLVAQVARLKRRRRIILIHGTEAPR